MEHIRFYLLYNSTYNGNRTIAMENIDDCDSEEWQPFDDEILMVMQQL